LATSVTSAPVERTASKDPERTLERQKQVIEGALAARSLETLFQPIVDLRGGAAVGAEALARFAAPPIRPPDVWFAEAASVGLGVELELAALRVALEHLRRLPSGLYMSVNASVETIMSDGFRAMLDDVPAERIVLELTEHSEVQDYTQFERAVRHLRSTGVRLAVDDAGAGYASFRHILNLHPDIIKLDIGLTRGIDGDPARRALGSALLAFGMDAYNATIVAEGIETEGEFKTLRALGCRFGQGFFLGRPGRLRVAPVKAPVADPLWRTPARGVGGAASAATGGADGDVRTAPQGLWHKPPSLPAGVALDRTQPAGGADPTSSNDLRDHHDEVLALAAEIRAREAEGVRPDPDRDPLSRLEALRTR
jgi:EAL domain-containing protein (putative c-di-GMP-specific phosphodiesterase class I)